MDVDSLPTSEADWPVFRIISTTYPQIALFERVAQPEDWDILYAIESLTNPRIRDEVGDISLVPVEQRVYGKGASWIMAAFTHLPAAGQGGRFNENFGVYYCAPEETTAIAETSYHRAKFLRESRIEQLQFDMRVLRAHLGPTSLVDVRQVDNAQLYDPNEYAYSQRFGAQVRARKLTGIHYASVRCTGECVAVMKPNALSNAIHLKYLRYIYQAGSVVRVEARTSSDATSNRPPEV